MVIFVYDGSFEGLLSCIFESYLQKKVPLKIESQARHQPALCAQITTIQTNPRHAKRVIDGLERRTQGQIAHQLYQVYLSEAFDLEEIIFRIAQLLIEKGEEIALSNFADPSVLRFSQIKKMMRREIHRMHAFVRFQKMVDGLFYASIEPDFDVIPLIGDHFEKRYADQAWLIFDNKRNYGLYYNQTETSIVSFEEHPNLANHILAEKEQNYQALWEGYFQSVNIKERKNLKLHVQHVPKRYWKYLPEKQLKN